MTVLMVGATGRHAHRVLEELLRRGARVRALVRNMEQARIARAHGAHEAAVGDLTRPASLLGAMDGVDAVFHIGPGLSPGETDMGVAMVTAAKTAGVRKFVFSGVIHPAISALTNHTAKLPVEDAIYSSGMNFTVLQPARFMQSFEDYWRIDDNCFGTPYAVTAKMGWVDYRDVAEVAAIALSGPELDYGTFELSAPGLWDSEQIAAILSRVAGRRITAVRVDADHFAQRLPAARRSAFTRMMAYYDVVGLPSGNAKVLRVALGREPRTVPGFLGELHTRSR